MSEEEKCRAAFVNWYDEPLYDIFATGEWCEDEQRFVFDIYEADCDYIVWLACWNCRNEQ